MKSKKYLSFRVLGLLIVLLFARPAFADWKSPVTYDRIGFTQIAADSGYKGRGTPAGNPMQTTQIQDCCTHLGQQVMCPQGLPPGSTSLELVPGGTQWVKPSGAIVFVPSTSFPLCATAPLSSTQLSVEKPPAPLTIAPPVEKPPAKTQTTLPTAEKPSPPPSQAPTAYPKPSRKPSQPPPQTGNFGNLPSLVDPPQPFLPASPPSEEGKELDRTIKGLGDLIRQQEQTKEEPQHREISGETLVGQPPENIGQVNPPHPRIKYGAGSDPLPSRSEGTSGDFLNIPSPPRSGGEGQGEGALKKKRLGNQVSELPAPPAIPVPKVMDPSGGETVPQPSFEIKKVRPKHRKVPPVANLPSAQLPGMGTTQPEDHEAAKSAGVTEAVPKPDIAVMEEQTEPLKAQGEERQDREEVSTVLTADGKTEKDQVSSPQLVGAGSEPALTSTPSRSEGTSGNLLNIPSPPRSGGEDQDEGVLKRKFLSNRVTLQTASLDETGPKGQEKILLTVLPSMAGLWVYLLLAHLTGPKGTLGAGVKMDCGALRRKMRG